MFRRGMVLAATAMAAGFALQSAEAKNIENVLPGQPSAAGEFGRASNDQERRSLKAAVAFAANNALFILYHEFGHLLVHELQWPVLGREEDAADSFAAWTMLSKQDDAMDEALADAAYGWFLSDKFYSSGLRDDMSQFYDEHSLDLQRAYGIVCLMVGYDPAQFAGYATKIGIDIDRQDRCAMDAEKVSQSVIGLLKDHRLEPIQGEDVTINYEEPDPSLVDAAAFFREAGVLEILAKDIRASYALPRSVVLVARTCYEPNAYYDFEGNEIIFCYELMHDFMDQYRRDIAGE